MDHHNKVKCTHFLFFKHHFFQSDAPDVEQKIDELSTVQSPVKHKKAHQIKGNSQCLQDC